MEICLNKNKSDEFQKRMRRGCTLCIIARYNRHSAYSVYVSLSKAHENVHVPCNEKHGKVHGNFHVPVKLQGTWKFPCTLPYVLLQVPIPSLCSKIDRLPQLPINLSLVFKLSKINKI